MKAESLASLLVQAIPAHSNAPGKGVLAFVKSRSPSGIRKLASRIATSHPSGSLPVYIADGGAAGEHLWPFSRIKKGARHRLDFGDIVTEAGGTIFPEDRPIVLLVEDFDCLEAEDQRAYCRLVDGEGHKHVERCSLHQGSVLLCGLTGKGKIEVGGTSRGVDFDLDDDS